MTVKTFVQEVREAASRLQRQYKLSSAAALQEAFETRAKSALESGPMERAAQALRDKARSEER
jgi:hypothetical protein